MNLVSVIVPVYNTAKFLPETIQSVLNQTYDQWELLLVDDGSTDISANVCLEYCKSDLRIKYFYKENGGQASARNLGIKEAHGKFIAFLDSDDLWLPNKLENQIDEWNRTNADFIYGLGFYYYPDQENKLIAYNWVTGKQKGEDFFKTLYHASNVNTNTVFVKRSVFDKVGLFDESNLLRGTEDWDMWMRIAKVVPIVYGSDSRNVYYRIHPGGIHFQYARMFIGKWKIYEKYDSDPNVPHLLRLREYRYVFRELINHLNKEGRHDEISDVFAIFMKKDPWGCGSIIQSICFRLLPLKSFLWVSNKLIYRLSYRLEKIRYRLSGLKPD